MSGKQENQIFFTKFPKEANREEIRAFFADCGDIKEVTLKRGYGFVVCI